MRRCAFSLADGPSELREQTPLCLPELHRHFESEEGVLQAEDLILLARVEHVLSDRIEVVEYIGAPCEQQRVMEAHGLRFTAQVAQLEAKSRARARGDARVMLRKQRGDVTGGAPRHGVGDGCEARESEDTSRVGQDRRPCREYGCGEVAADELKQAHQIEL